jgi:histone H3/H4
MGSFKLDEHYICQRAANAIISEIGPFRVSTDALQAINQFLDEFIVLLLTCSLSLDLSPIKAVVVSLLPSSLGKNAIVEAELEVKTFTETEAIDYELYERMRNLGTDNERFPLDIAVPLLREKCFEYCTLADKDDQLHLQRSIQKRGEKNAKVVISPVVAIYVTTVMEHIAEYLLTAVAMTAEHEDTDYVRVKEVFLALIDDIQLGDVFNRMDLHDKMEVR